MRRTNKIIITLIIIAMLLLGVGYAAIENITLNIIGQVQADPSQANFRVMFTEPITVSDNSKITASIEENPINAKVDVVGLTAKGQTVTATYTIKNASADLSADLTVATTNSNTEYFTLQSELAKTSLVAGESTTVTVTITLIKTPISEAVSSTVGVQLIAAPVQPGEEGSSGITNYTVTYDANGGEGAPVDSNQYGEGATVAVNFETVPTKAGYTFLGWATSSDAIDATYTSTGITSFTMGGANVTLYAVWAQESTGEIPAGLEVGDTITYSPSGTYNWQAEYASSDLTPVTDDVMLSSATGEDFNLTSWKIFSVDENSRTVQLVPTAPTTGRVSLSGAQGYNNGVKLLNDACSNLYGNSAKGISARSINIEDIEGLLKEGFEEEVEWDGYLSPYYGEQSDYAFAENKNYPTIYAEEDLSVIDGNKIEKNEGLGRSHQNDFFGRNDEGATNGIISTATSIQPYQTVWYIYSKTLDELAEGDTYKLISPISDDDSYDYWIASRGLYVEYSEIDPSGNVHDDADFCEFAFFSYWNGGYIDKITTFSSKEDESTEAELSIFPVLTLNADLITGSDAAGWEIK